MQRFDAIRHKIEGGLIPAVPVPRYQDGTIHSAAHDAYVHYLCEQPISGVAVWSHTGRGLFLTEQEREYICSSWKRCLGSEQLLIAGVGAACDPSLPYDQRIRIWSSRAEHMTEHAVALGADALLVFPPVIYKELPPQQRDQCIIDYHLSLSQFGVPLIVFYLYEEAGGVDYSATVLNKLLSMPETLGIKMASLDRIMVLQNISALIRTQYSDKLLITGEDRMFGYSLMRGARSVLMGLGAAYPHIQYDLIQTYHNGCYERFMELSSQIDQFAEATFTDPMDQYVARMLWCLTVAGVIPEDAAYDMNGNSLSNDEQQHLRQVIQGSCLY